MNDTGIKGAILQMLNHGVSTGALFILVGVIYERRHTRELDAFGGLVKVMPWYALIFIVVTMSSIGLPGTNGFVGEFMILAGTFASGAGGGVSLSPWSKAQALLAATGVIFAAVYMLHAVYKLFWGPIKHKVNEKLEDLTAREMLILAPLVFLIFWIGFYPRTFLEPMDPAVDQLVAQVGAKRGRPAPAEQAALIEVPSAWVDTHGAVLDEDDEDAPAADVKETDTAAEPADPPNGAVPAQPNLLKPAPTPAKAAKPTPKPQGLRIDPTLLKPAQPKGAAPAANADNKAEEPAQ